MAHAVRVNFLLPFDVFAALKTLVPERQRSRVVTRLLENEIEKRKKALSKTAQAVDNDQALNKDRTAWAVTLGDGLGDNEWK
jgi:hypothetical protein